MNNGMNKDPHQAGSLTSKPVRRPHPEGRRLRYVRRRGKGPNPGLVIIIAIAALIVAVSIVFIVRRPSDAPTPVQTDTEPVSSSEAETEPVGSYFTEVEVPSSSVAEGDLILVNYSHEYVFPEKDDLVNIYENKTGNFKVAFAYYMLDRRVLDVFASMTEELVRREGEDDLTINSAYRSLEEQREIYDSYTESGGAEYAALYVADPGKSEHHTGLALDITLVRDDGSAMPFRQSDSYGLICDLLTEYGFILRYPADKKDVTRIENEPWHYRYVGAPHSYIIEKTGLCLEEYETFLKNYSADGEVIFLGDDGVLRALAAESAAGSGDGYAVWFAEAADGELTKIPVPADAPYSVSGNNEDGFIVTATFGEPEVTGVQSVDGSVEAAVKAAVGEIAGSD